MEMTKGTITIHQATFRRSLFTALYIGIHLVAVDKTLMQADFNKMENLLKWKLKESLNNQITEKMEKRFGFRNSWSQDPGGHHTS